MCRTSRHCRLPSCQMIVWNPSIWLGYPFSEHADSAQPRNLTLYTRGSTKPETVNLEIGYAEIGKWGNKDWGSLCSPIYRPHDNVVTACNPKLSRTIFDTDTTPYRPSRKERESGQNCCSRVVPLQWLRWCTLDVTSSWCDGNNIAHTRVKAGSQNDAVVAHTADTCATDCKDYGRALGTDMCACGNTHLLCCRKSAREKRIIDATLL